MKALDELLLRTAKANYPLGTVYISASAGNGHTPNIELNREASFENTPDGESYIMGNYGTSVYWKGKWAQIISLPEGYISELDEARLIIYAD